MLIKKENTLKNYYRNFFNYQYQRDLRFLKKSILIGTKVSQPKADFLHNFHYNNITSDSRASNKFFSFILNKHHRNGKGNLVYQISNYNSLLNYKSNPRETYVDRLFFDFDLESNEDITKIKDNLKKARETTKGKERIAKIKEEQNNFRDLILNTDLLKKPFNDCMSLKDYFQRNGFKPYILFSGGKGLHLNIFFNNIQVSNINVYSSYLANKLKKELNLTTLDLAVNQDADRRMQRVPYTLHNDTLLLNQNVSNVSSFDEFLDIIKNDKFNDSDFNINDFKSINKPFEEILSNFDKEYSAKLKIKLEYKELERKKDEINFLKSRIKREKERKNQKNNTSSASDYVPNEELFNIDMRVICKYFLGDPVREYSKYNSYKCIFHNDNIASALVYKNNYYCKACNLNLQHYSFIRKYYEVKENREISNKEIREILSKFL